jgi:hypothetical protein
MRGTETRVRECDSRLEDSYAKQLIETTARDNGSLGAA